MKDREMEDRGRETEEYSEEGGRDRETDGDTGRRSREAQTNGALAQLVAARATGIPPAWWRAKTYPSATSI